jgi:predicted ATPase
MTAATQWDRPDLPRAVPRRVASPVLVGRRKEMAWLGEALTRVDGGSPAALLIGGDAGVGKSRLVSEFGAAAPAVRVLTGKCPELGTIGLPFAPLRAILRDLVRDRGFADLIGSPDRELIRLLPELGQPAATGTFREARARLFVETLSLLEQLGRQQPTVLVIEDAQWADESTRELLYFLIDNQDAMRGVLIIVTYRSCELHRGHPFCALLPRLSRLGWVQRTELAGLGRDESAELVGHLLDGAPGLPLAERVYRRAEGIPLLIEELVGADRERSWAGTATTYDLMLAAIRRLPEPTQDVLRVASIGGQRTGRGLLAAVTGLSADALEVSVRPALERGVLEAHEDYFTFRHALISEALHQDLLPGEHTSTHQRFAAALREDSSLVPAGCAAIEEAEHWQHAHDPARALGSAWRAAADAGLALARAEQLAMLTRVLELWESVPDAKWLTGADHALVLRQAADVATAAGERQLATALASAAQDETVGHAAPGRAARPLRN